MDDQALIDWLLEGDVAIQHQVWRDLLGEPRPDLQRRIATEGWGARFLGARNPDGHWGRAYYAPKWTSTHYTLLDLRNLELPPNNPLVAETLAMVLDTCVAPDGGINPPNSTRASDVCINGMFLHVAAWFRVTEERLRSVVDFVLSEWMDDGGFNCQSNRQGATHSSMHTTISALEGIHTYLSGAYTYRAEELATAAAASRDFLLAHRLFRSHRTGEVIKPAFLKLSYPSRWYFDVLRGLEHFAAVGQPHDRLADALEVLRGKRRKDRTWPVQAKYPGQTHFDMEQAGKPSRWNTLRALRALKTLG